MYHVTNSPYMQIQFYKSNAGQTFAGNELPAPANNIQLAGCSILSDSNFRPIRYVYKTDTLKPVLIGD